MYICKFCGKECKNNNSLLNHERLCKENPNRQISYFIVLNRKRSEGLIKSENQYTKAKRLNLEKPKVSEAFSKSWLGKCHTEEQKKKISDSMKKAHLEGRAHNIGESRWNNKPSYPEQWFMQVIENEFNNKNYIREYYFNKYSLDFAWPDIKKCIEIDGEQHERFEDYKQRDIQKDKLLNEHGWQVLRIKWVECFNNPKYYINIAKTFIGEEA